MGRAKKAVLAGAGVAGAAAAVMARRPRSGASGAGPGASGTSGTTVLTTTILRPVDEVTRAWAAEGEADDRTGDRPVSVEFGAAPGGRGTEVRARVGPGPSSAGQGDDGGDGGVAGNGGPGSSSGGPAGGLLDRLRGETPAQRQRDRLRRFKATVECGEVITTEGQPSGRGPAQEALTQAVTRRLRAWSGQ